MIRRIRFFIGPRSGRCNAEGRRGERGAAEKAEDAEGGLSGGGIG
jgi:hypothetical protein